MNTETKQKEETFEVTEEKDGSVVVELPEGMAVAEASEDGQNAAGDDGHDDDQPGDTDAIREARRARRRAKKEYIKRTNEEKDQRHTYIS